ncbi:MAG TPA: hypothetical protein VNT50_12075 [Microbacterium sp.]|uniref:hypothetical protein n=1 Tax=Microbacterium sp. TaxID=51671 RepID=UPI002CD6C1D7|nr:hypothetical protein [Microbacterium sp.]HWI32221.1 hypothetical protein [Microbacterium sp.]
MNGSTDVAARERLAVAHAGRGVFGSSALRVGVIYLASRLVTTGFLLLAGALSPPGSRFGPGAGIPTYVLAWDAQWYQRIAAEGYPTVLPLTDAGDVAHNAWAFMPLYPWLSSALGAALGSWGAGAVLIAFAAGYACCIVLRRMLVAKVGEAASLWAVAFFASAPLGAMFQVAYPETLFLLLIMLGIVGLQRRRYGWLYALVPAMAFLRPGVLAFALMLGFFGIGRWISRRREPLRKHEPVHIVALAALATALGLSWPVIAGWVTGRSDAYLQTELSWRRLWMGDEGEFVPFEGWLQAADYWFREWGLDPVWALGAIIVGVAATAALLLFEPHVRRLGMEIRLWAASYLLYLLAVFLPQSSVFRLLFPLSPLWGALAQPRSTTWRVAVLVACLVGQGWWIWNVYGLGNQFWHIP